MEDKPLLIFPKPSANSERTKLYGRQGNPSLPKRERQIERIEGEFSQLFDVLKSKRVFLQQNVAGAIPEMVLVLEFVGSVKDFSRLFRRCPNLNF